MTGAVTRAAKGGIPAWTGRALSVRANTRFALACRRPPGGRPLPAWTRRATVRGPGTDRWRRYRPPSLGGKGPPKPRRWWYGLACHRRQGSGRTGLYAGVGTFRHVPVRATLACVPGYRRPGLIANPMTCACARPGSARCPLGRWRRTTTVTDGWRFSPAPRSGCHDLGTGLGGNSTRHPTHCLRCSLRRCASRWCHAYRRHPSDNALCHLFVPQRRSPPTLLASRHFGRTSTGRSSVGLGSAGGGTGSRACLGSRHSGGICRDSICGDLGRNRRSTRNAMRLRPAPSPARGDHDTRRWRPRRRTSGASWPRCS
jgi:hypothetical protein